MTKTITDYTFDGGVISQKKRKAKATTKKSKWESDFEWQLKYSLDAGLIDSYEYESMRFQIGVGATYTPDFIVERDEMVEVVEVKGFPNISQHGVRNNVASSIAREKGISKFRIAAMIYSGIVLNENHNPVYWRLVELKDNQWKTIMLITDGEKLTRKEIEEYENRGG